MFIGIHQSFSGLVDLVADATSIGSNTYQFFIRNNRNMKMRPFTIFDYSAFNQSILNSNIGCFVVHASYALNPASYDVDIRNRTKEIIRQDMEVLQHLCMPKYYVLHPGAHKDGDRYGSIELLAQTLHECANTFKGTRICVENMAGQGTQIITDIDEMQTLCSLCWDIPEFSFCIDTCHAFAAGLDSKELYVFLDQLPSEMLGCIHLNNSQTGFGSRVDRHANLELGRIKTDELLYTTHCLHQRNKQAPIILETPGELQLHDYELTSKFFESKGEM